MTREEIEKAAFYSIDAPCVRDCDKCNDKYKNDCMWSIYRDGFVDGAKWRIKKVWHKPNEDPVKKKYLLLVEANDGEFSLSYTFDPATTNRWAYVKDLMPEE